MKKKERYQRQIARINRFFLIAGLIEIFLLVFITTKVLTMLVGTLTVLGVYMALYLQKINWNYFNGIWALVKYNPFTGIPLIAFLLGDLFSISPYNNTGYTLAMVLAGLTSLIAITSFILGIVLLVKTSKYSKNSAGS